MSEPIIQARGLGIRFDKGRQKQGSLKNLFVRRQANQPKHVEEFWPLRNINFDIYPGDSVGVIGSNGTGKSTLLRLITGVLLPDEGHVTRRGNVAPLIALSAGFSGDLTGRENIQLVGALHGLTNKEIKVKFDEIVDFAELEDFIDTPVRHYSSGMKVRLGFAVITQLPHPILLVDEALAVGDRRFKRKCHDVIEGLLEQGRTLVFVSHAASDLKRYCKRGLFMDAGELIVDGTVEEALDAYAKTDEAKDKAARARRKKKADARKKKANDEALAKVKDKKKDKGKKTERDDNDSTLILRAIRDRKADKDSAPTSAPAPSNDDEDETSVLPRPQGLGPLQDAGSFDVPRSHSDKPATRLGNGQQSSEFDYWGETESGANPNRGGSDEDLPTAGPSTSRPLTGDPQSAYPEGNSPISSIDYRSTDTGGDEGKPPASAGDRL